MQIIKCVVSRAHITCVFLHQSHFLQSAEVMLGSPQFSKKETFGDCQLWPQTYVGRRDHISWSHTEFGLGCWRLRVEWIPVTNE